MNQGGAQSPPIFRNCKNCNKQFKVVLLHESVIYCSYECANLYYENGEQCQSNQKQMKSSG